MYYYVKENPTELFYERHQLLVGQTKSASLAKRLRTMRQKSTSRTTAAGAFGFLVAAIMVATLTLILGVSRPAHAATTFTVNTTADFPDAFLNDTVNVCDADSFLWGKQCTLRAAIEEANATDGADTIRFNIPDDFGSGVKTINVGANGDGQLPTISEAVTIDGYTQPGASPNTLAKGTNAKILIELNGQCAGPIARGLAVDAPNTMVRGLVINRFSLEGVRAISDDGVRIEGNFIGTDPTGTIDLGNSGDGVLLNGASNSTVGGSTPDKRNLISGDDIDGVFFLSNNTTKVQGNLIGIKRDGKSRPGNSRVGVGIFSSSNNIVGGASAAEANTIAFNDGDGVVVFSKESRGNRILGNSIFSNASDGIDLVPENSSPEGPTPNDPGDSDRGADGLQNKPAIASAITSAGKTTIKGKLSTKANKTFVVRFFSNPPGNEGKTFIGQKKVTTYSEGRVSFTFLPAQKVGVGKTVTATATGPEGTSEFSAPREVTAS